MALNINSTVVKTICNFCAPSSNTALTYSTITNCNKKTRMIVPTYFTLSSLSTTGPATSIHTYTVPIYQQLNNS